MRRFLVLVSIALSATAPAMVFRLLGWRPNALLDSAVFGVAVLAAGFMLSWAAEAAERRISKGLILAGVALITVLPEYAVDMYYAFQAGRFPESNYVHYAAANMTGANRLLVGVAWPLMVLLYWWRTRQRSIELATVNSVEIGFLLLASVYAFVILFKNRIDAVDAFVLITIFSAYLWQVGRLPKADSDKDEDEDPGPAAALTKLGGKAQWSWMAGLGIVAAVVILMSAEPFAESIVASGRILGIDEFLLIQWLAPFASEAPAVVIAILFVLSGRAAAGLTTMISDKINQWTLLVGMLPLAMSVGAGQLMSLPLDARQHEEFFLTAAQSLFGIALLMRLRFSIRGAVALAALFAAQVSLALFYRDDPARLIASLTWLGWVYLALALAVFVKTWPALPTAIRFAFRLASSQSLQTGQKRRSR